MQENIILRIYQHIFEWQIFVIKVTLETILKAKTAKEKDDIARNVIKILE